MSIKYRIYSVAQRVALSSFNQPLTINIVSPFRFKFSHNRRVWGIIGSKSLLELAYVRWTPKTTLMRNKPGLFCTLLLRDFFLNVKRNKQTNKLTNSTHLWIDGGHLERSYHKTNRLYWQNVARYILIDTYLFQESPLKRNFFSILIRETIRNSKHVLFASVGGLQSRLFAPEHRVRDLFSHTTCGFRTLLINDQTRHWIITTRKANRGGHCG